MARPTDERKDKTVKLRISEDLYEELAKKGPNLSETIRNILKNGDGAEKNIDSFVPQKDLREMAMCFGVSSEEMLSKVVEALENGEFTFVGGKIVAVEEPWVDAFRETCHDLCIPVEKACESAIKALRRGV